MNKDTIRNIIELGRLRFLAAGFFLYLMGVLLAIVSGADYSVSLLLLGYAIMMPAHLSISYSNNYFDREVDRYNEPGTISGGSKTLLNHPELLNLCKNIAIALIVISMIIAFLVTVLLSYSVWFFVFIIAGNLIGWFYTAPPLRFAYRGFGEIANMINMGLLMPGIGYWIMKGSIDVFYIVYALPFFLYGLVFMIIVESPDMEGDKQGKKKTVIVKIGRLRGYMIMLSSLCIASIYYLVLYFLGWYQQYLNYFLVFLISLFPLIVALHGWSKKLSQKLVAKITAQKNMMMLIVSIILLDVYLFFVIY